MNPFLILGPVFILMGALVTALGINLRNDRLARDAVEAAKPRWEVACDNEGHYGFYDGDGYLWVNGLTMRSYADAERQMSAQRNPTQKDLEVAAQEELARAAIKAKFKVCR
jgi:hypothetical protein